jgi:hypothetical protein
MELVGLTRLFTQCVINRQPRQAFSDGDFRRGASEGSRQKDQRPRRSETLRSRTSSLANASNS